MQQKRLIFLGLGSNVGNRRKNIFKAYATICASILDDTHLASLYRTDPWGEKEQPVFLNTVMCGFTCKPCSTLLSQIQQIEKALGRSREKEKRWGPRVIDIDILLYGKEIISTSSLTVPHPQMINRKFVLIPLLELHPTLREPNTNTSYITYLNRLEKQGIYYFSLDRYYRTFRTSKTQI